MLNFLKVGIHQAKTPLTTNPREVTMLPGFSIVSVGLENLVCECPVLSPTRKTSYSHSLLCEPCR